MKIKHWIFAAILFLVGLYMFLPVINIHFKDLPILIIVIILLIVVFQLRKNLPNSTGANIIKIVLAKLKSIKILSILLFGTLGFMLVYQLFFTAKIFRAGSYRNLIGNVTSDNVFSKDIAPIAIDKIRVVDEELANLLGEKVIGQQASLGSKAHLGRFTIQKVKSQLYWVAPLLHSGFFKWLNNLEGTDGYVMVSATNERDVQLVQQINKQPLKIKYQPDSYFNFDLHRYLYTHGNFTKGLTDFSFEINDDGIPFWVVTTYTNTIGYSGADATGVIILNAQDGVIENFTNETTPAWVDRIQPEAFVQTQVKDWGELVKGYWNFGNEDKLMPTENVSLVYGEDNNSYWYTGLTSVGADESTVGFMLINTRTKAAKWYKQSGATEKAAQGSAMGKVQEKGYYASDATPYNINNIPSYLMTLKDKSGLVKMYAMVAIEDFTVVGVGNNLNDCLMNYKNQYYQASNKITPSSQSKIESLTSTIARFQPDVKNGNTLYYFTLKGNKTIFVSSAQLSNSIPLTQIGDSVVVTYDKDSAAIMDVQTFNNLSLGQQ